MSQFLNISPILFDQGSINVEKIEYTDALFDKLLQTYRNSHFVKRSGDSIILVPMDNSSVTCGGESTVIDLKEDLSLASSLAREAIYRQLLKRDLHISNLRPISYLVTNKNLLEVCIPPTQKLIQGLGIFAKWELDFRVIDPNGNGPFVGMSINISTAPRISISCNSLISSGLSINGYYVGISNASKNPDLRPHFRVVGRVVCLLDNGMLELDDVRDGHPTRVDPIDVYLEPREDILEYCIRHFYKDHAAQVLGNMQAYVASFHIGNKKVERLMAGLAQLQSFNLKLAGIIPFKIGSFLSDDSQLSDYSIKVNIAEKPRFVFSYGGNHSGFYNDLGLQKYGPYSKESFTPAKPRICIICQIKKKGQVELVLQKFLNGISPIAYGKEGKSFEFTGLKTKFYLQDCLLDFFGANDDTVEGYNKAITAAMQAGSEGKGWDLALIQIDSTFRNRPPDANPYFTSKARFVGNGIPVQEFTLESLGLPDQRVIWSLNNMALATYAKLGGVPWLLAAEPPIAHELVFGIGSSTVQNGRLGQKERMIGITTVFTGDGNYFINNISAAVQTEEYFETLLTNVRLTMTKIRQAYNWQPRDSVRLIFHAFKTFKDVEAEVVKQVVHELGDYNVEFSFVHVAENHPFLMFDTQQTGAGYYKKGIYAPERGRYIQLSEHTSLVSLTGAQELKQANDGLPKPVQLILHRDSTFKDLTYLSKQVIKFGAHSWRSYMPAPMPVSIYYSQLMAQMLGQLNSITSWNPDALYNKIGTTRWFL